MSEFYIFTLTNGLRCVLAQRRSGVVHAALTINAGSRDDFVGKEGLAHLVEHSLFKGTERRRAWQVNCRLENLGGELNAFTTKEETVVHATTLRRDYRAAVELLADIIFHSTFPEYEIEKEQQVVLDEIDLYGDTSPSELIYDEFEERLFNTDIGHNILGTREMVEAISRDDIVEFVNSRYTTDNMVFSLIGNISEKNFRNIAERYFGDIPAGIRTFQRQRGEHKMPSNFHGTNHTNQTHAIIGAFAYEMGNERNYPLAVLTNLLGGPTANSLLNVLLRERHGLSYNVESTYTALSDTGLVTIYYECDKRNKERCTELINKQLIDIKTTLLSPRNLALAKKQFIGQIMIASENNEAYMLAAARSMLFFSEIDEQRNIIAKINSISAETIREVANEIFIDMSTLIYG